jgi:hypothetical protein
MEKSVFDFLLMVIISTNVKRIQKRQGCSLTLSSLIRYCPDFNAANFPALAGQIVELAATGNQADFRAVLARYGMLTVDTSAQQLIVR